MPGLRLATGSATEILAIPSLKLSGGFAKPGFEGAG